MGWLAKLFPGAILTRLMVYALVFALGGAVGNSWATKRALERELQASADRMRENHLAFFEEFRRRNAEFKARMVQQQAADKAAYAVLEQGKAEAEQSAQRARASLRIALAESQKLKETTDGLRNVNDMLAAEARRPDPPCAVSGRVRLAIDTYIASINASIAGSPEAPAAKLPYGQDQAPPVSCDQLARSVIDILQHDAELVARDQAWASWAREALR